MKEIQYTSKSKTLHGLLSEVIAIDAGYQRTVKIHKGVVRIALFAFLEQAVADLKVLGVNEPLYTVLCQAYLYVYRDKRMEKLDREDSKRHQQLKWGPKHWPGAEQERIENSVSIKLSTEPSVAMSTWLSDSLPRLVKLGEVATKTLQSSKEWAFDLKHAKRFNLYTLFLVHLSLINETNLKDYLDSFVKGTSLNVGKTDLLVLSQGDDWVISVTHAGVRREMVLSDEAVFRDFKDLLKSGADLVLAIEEMYALSVLNGLFEDVE